MFEMNEEYFAYAGILLEGSNYVLSEKNIKAKSYPTCSGRQDLNSSAELLCEKIIDAYSKIDSVYDLISSQYTSIVQSNEKFQNERYKTVGFILAGEEPSDINNQYLLYECMVEIYRMDVENYEKNGVGPQMLSEEDQADYERKLLIVSEWDRLNNENSDKEKLLTAFNAIISGADSNTTEYLEYSARDDWEETIEKGKTISTTMGNDGKNAGYTTEPMVKGTVPSEYQDMFYHKFYEDGLTQEQKDVYFYKLAKYGYEEANDYLQQFASIIYKKGMQEAIDFKTQRFENANEVGKFFLATGSGIREGVAGFFQSTDNAVSSWMHGEDAPINTPDMTSQINSGFRNYLETEYYGWDIVYDISTVVGNELPVMIATLPLAGAVSGAKSAYTTLKIVDKASDAAKTAKLVYYAANGSYVAVNTCINYADSYGRNYAYAIQNGASYDTACEYANNVAVGEVAIDAFTSAIPTERVIPLSGSKIVDYALDAAGEIGQDIWQMNQANEILGENNSLSVDDAIHTTVVSLGSSFILGNGNAMVLNTGNTLKQSLTNTTFQNNVYSATGTEISYNQMINDIKNGDSTMFFNGISITHPSQASDIVNSFDSDTLNALIEHGTDEQVGNLLGKLDTNASALVIQNTNSQNLPKVFENMSEDTLHDIFAPKTDENGEFQYSDYAKTLEGIEQTFTDSETNITIDQNTIPTINLDSLEQLNGVTVPNINLADGTNATIDNTPLQQTIDMNAIIAEINNKGENFDATGSSKQCFYIEQNGQEYAVLVNNKTYNESDLNSYVNRINATNKLADLGVNTPRVVDYHYDQENGIMYEVQEKVSGQQVALRNIGFAGGKENYINHLDSSLDLLLNLNVDQYINFLNQVQILKENGVSLDFNPDNFYIDENGNISFIDLGTPKSERILTQNDYLQVANSIEYIFSKITNRITEELSVFGSKLETVATNSYNAAIEYLTQNGISQESINEYINNKTIAFDESHPSVLDQTYGIKDANSFVDNLVNNNIEDTKISQNENTKLFTVKDFAMLLPDIGINIFNLAGRKSMGSSLTATQNQEVLNKIKEEGIVHITSDESAGLILDSNYVKKTKAGIQSYGTAKSFFFAGTPTIEGVAFNLDKLKTVMTGVRIRPTDAQMSDLKVRFSDGSIFNKGDFNFESGQAEQVYYGLTFEDGNLVYKEITAEQAQNYQPDVTAEQLAILNNKWALGLKTLISGMQADRVKLLSDIQKYKGKNGYNEVIDQLGTFDTNTKNESNFIQQNDILEDNTALINNDYDLSGDTNVLETLSDDLISQSNFDINNLLNRNDASIYIENLSVGDFENILSQVSRDNYSAFANILSPKSILSNIANINQDSFNKLMDIIFSNRFTTLTCFRNENFVNSFVERASDKNLTDILASGSIQGINLFEKIDKNKLNTILNNISDKNCYDDLFRTYRDQEIIFGEIEAINIFNTLKQHGFATDKVNDYFAWLANEYAYNINVQYDVKVEKNNDVYNIRRSDGTEFKLKNIDKHNLSNGNEVYTYEYSYIDFDGFIKTKIIYSDLDLNFMLENNFSVEQLADNFLSVDRITESIRDNFGYLGSFSLVDGKLAENVNLENISLIINETANQYHFYLEGYQDLNAGMSFGVDQHATAKMAIINPKAFKELCQKFVSKGLKYRDAVKILKSLDNTGACSYAAICNTIYAFYKDNPQGFKQDFGFDMYVYNSEYNYYSLNTTELLADIYIYVNNKSNSPMAHLFEGINKIKITDKSLLGKINTKNQQYLSGSLGTNTGLVNNYLKSKNPKLNFSSETIILGETRDNLSNNDINEIRKKISDAITSGKVVNLGIYRGYTELSGKGYDNTTTTFVKKGNVRFMTEDGETYIDTDTWSEGAGHAVFVSSVVENGVWVSSWGKKLFIPFSDLQNARFTVLIDSITGINNDSNGNVNVDSNNLYMQNSAIDTNNTFNTSANDFINLTQNVSNSLLELLVEKSYSFSDKVKNVFMENINKLSENEIKFIEDFKTKLFGLKVEDSIPYKEQLMNYFSSIKYDGENTIESYLKAEIEKYSKLVNNSKLTYDSFINKFYDVAMSLVNPSKEKAFLDSGENSNKFKKSLLNLCMNFFYINDSVELSNISQLAQQYGLDIRIIDSNGKLIMDNFEKLKEKLNDKEVRIVYKYNEYLFENLKLEANEQNAQYAYDFRNTLRKYSQQLMAVSQELPETGTDLLNSTFESAVLKKMIAEKNKLVNCKKIIDAFYAEDKNLQKGSIEDFIYNEREKLYDMIVEESKFNPIVNKELYEAYSVTIESATKANFYVDVCFGLANL